MNPCSTSTFGSGVLGKEPGQQRPCGSGFALLAVHERWWSGGVVLGWSVEGMGGSGGQFIARRPVHGGHGAGAVQGASGLAIGAATVLLRCWGAEGQEGLRGGERRKAVSVVMDDLGMDLRDHR